MHQKVHFFRISYMEEKDLKNKIIGAIQKEEVKRAKVFVGFSLVTSILSFVGVFYSIKYLAESFVRLGLNNYISLIFSDTDIVLKNWQYLSLSILEALPLFQITVAFAILFVFMLSVRILANNMRKNIGFNFIS